MTVEEDRPQGIVPASIIAALVTFGGFLVLAMANNAWVFEYPLDDVYIHLAVAEEITRSKLPSTHAAQMIRKRTHSPASIVEESTGWEAPFTVTNRPRGASSDPREAEKSPPLDSCATRRNSPKSS